MKLAHISNLTCEDSWLGHNASPDCTQVSSVWGSLYYSVIITLFTTFTLSSTDLRWNMGIREPHHGPQQPQLTKSFSQEDLHPKRSIPLQPLCPSSFQPPHHLSLPSHHLPSPLPTTFLSLATSLHLTQPLNSSSLTQSWLGVSLFCYVFSH